ncbi:MAG: hypothetical protein WCE90_10110 [Candidatus Zixiibacteriota bacterium]
MLSRRKFLKVLGLTSLAFSLLPSFLARKSFSSSVKDAEVACTTRNWLYGSPRRGCSTPNLAFEYHAGSEAGLQDFVNLRIPPGLAFRTPDEQYLS